MVLIGMNVDERAKCAMVFIAGLILGFSFLALTITPAAECSLSPAGEINNLIYSVKSTPGHGAPGNLMRFRDGDAYTAEGIASIAQLNPESVFFCVSDAEMLANIDKDACPDDFIFDTSIGGPFEGSKEDILYVREDVSGRPRAYRTTNKTHVDIWIGFKEQSR